MDADTRVAVGDYCKPRFFLRLVTGCVPPKVIGKVINEYDRLGDRMLHVTWDNGIVGSVIETDVFLYAKGNTHEVSAVG